MAPGLAHCSGPSEPEFRRQERAVAPLVSGVSQLRTWIMQMSTDAAVRIAGSRQLFNACSGLHYLRIWRLRAVGPNLAS